VMMRISAAIIARAGCRRLLGPVTEGFERSI
jgi:hypothetical protein